MRPHLFANFVERSNTAYLANRARERRVVALHQRLQAAKVARSWVGTPFHHGARLKGIGVDCAQLVVGVHVEVGAYAEPGLEEYPAQWMLHTDDKRMEAWLERLYVRSERPRVGDLAAFHAGRAVSHAAIVVKTGEVPEVVHADPRQGVTVAQLGRGHAMRSRLAGYWTPRAWVEG